LAFVKKRGVVLMSARGPVPNLAEAIAGGPIRGSWWGHPKSHHMFHVFETVCDSEQILVCRLVGGKVTFVHRRLWPALVRLAGQLPKRGLAAVREEHTARGHHRTVVTPYPRWVPKAVQREARRLTVEQAISRLGAEMLLKASGRKFVRPVGDPKPAPAADARTGRPRNP
jgi:hypothetical protein